MTTDTIPEADTGHNRWCVLYCSAGHCIDQHVCWCLDGALSAAQFAERYPRWLKLPYAQWLDTDEGAAWFNAMEDNN